jgi:glyoxylase-like metal-dependent hydrolase (beta-lactamase superfamily II)
MYLKQFEVNELMVFSYLLGCRKTGEALVIDPAGGVDTILKEAEKEGLRILRIVNTHGHIDHIMGNEEMKKKTNAKIIIHEGDAEGIVNVSPYTLQMFNARPSPPPDVTVRDGDAIAFGEKELQVIHTPGHSPGSMCLYLKGYLFTGDTLFVEGVGRTDLPGASGSQLYNSITQKIFSLPDDTIVLPGHKYGPRPTSTIGDEKQNNPFIQEAI